MKFLRLTLSVALISFSTVAFAQSGSQKSFDSLKALAGPWQGHVTTTPPKAGMGDMANVQVTLRVTSRGNALVHEMKAAGTPTTRRVMTIRSPCCTWTAIACSSHTIAMPATGRAWLPLLRPTARKWNSIFSISRVARRTDTWIMRSSPSIDANHHTEDWTYIMPGDKPIHAHMDLSGQNDGASISARTIWEQDGP